MVSFPCLSSSQVGADVRSTFRTVLANLNATTADMTATIITMGRSDRRSVTIVPSPFHRIRFEVYLTPIRSKDSTSVVAGFRRLDVELDKFPFSVKGRLVSMFMTSIWAIAAIAPNPKDFYRYDETIDRVFIKLARLLGPSFSFQIWILIQYRLRIEPGYGMSRELLQNSLSRVVFSGIDKCFLVIENFVRA